MAVAGKIAEAAQSEMSSTWHALAESSAYGDSFLERKIAVVKTRLFGEIVSEAVEAALDVLVIDYAGKCVALELVNPGIDYWSKQPLSLAATGRSENKTYNDRSAALRVLKENLLEQTRLMWPEVQTLLPGRRFRTAVAVPTVRQIEVAPTPKPYDFEQPFG